jgi:hypothetical protein
MSRILAVALLSSPLNHHCLMLASGQKPVGKEERGSSVHLTPSLQSTAQSPIQHWDTALLTDNASLDPSSNNAQAPPSPNNLKPHSSSQFTTHSLNIQTSLQERLPYTFPNLKCINKKQEPLPHFPPHLKKKQFPLEMIQSNKTTSRETNVKFPFGTVLPFAKRPTCHPNLVTV